MIEAIVDHIRRKGFKVAVLSERLIIFKDMQGMRYEYSWAISRCELNAIPLEVLLGETDHHLAEIDQAAQRGAVNA